MLTIETECLSGIPDIDKYADIVRDCADNLRAFIGTGEPNTFDPVGEDYEERVNALCEKHGCEPGSDRLAWLDERLAAGITPQGAPDER